jgi:hypothetical protein
MDAAWVGFAGGVFAAALSAGVALRQSRMEARLLLLGRQLDSAERAEEVLRRYRQPLAAAAFDLQARLYNILRLDFVERFGGGHPLAEQASRTTLFRIAQYFGWSEILRRDIQFLSFPEEGDTRTVAAIQAQIAERFLDSGPGAGMMIWRDEQRAIGERMIVEEHGKVLCMGYAAFSDCCRERFGPSLERMWAEVEEPAAQARMRAVQHALCDLVRLLDPRGVLYPAGALRRA